MKKMRAISACLVAFIYVTMLFGSGQHVKAVSGQISTDQAIYPIWGVGGTVRVTFQNLATNVTYYLWLEKPTQLLPYALGVHFTSVNGASVPPVQLTIASSDPPGTYDLTLSTSPITDTKEATVHFGVSGTDSQSYERTRTVVVAGGGFAANSSIALEVAGANKTFPGFPMNITAGATGEYKYTFKLSPSAPDGTFKATETGLTFDKHQATTVSSEFIIAPATISVRSNNTLPLQIERTAQVNATYILSYPDASAVTNVTGTVDILSGGQKLISVPLTPLNATIGEWVASWVPPPSANITTYHFQLNPTGLTDPYGNSGAGSPVASNGFGVVLAKLQPTIQTQPSWQRTQNVTIGFMATYHNGANVANLTQVTVNVTQPGGTHTKTTMSLNGTSPVATFKIPVNATLGNWTGTWSMRDPWGNGASGKFTFQVLLAVPVFQLNTPPTTQRTTSLNVTTKVSYPDGTPINKTLTLVISHGNQTIVPNLSFNSTTLTWSASHYFDQNTTLGPYNVTWSEQDQYGNMGSINSTTQLIPAQFMFLLKSNNSTLSAFSNLDLPVIVTYPNGTGLRSTFGNVSLGNVTGSYQNSTGYTFFLPLAYNATNSTWHMYFQTPEQGNFTFSFNAVDRYGNAGQAMDAYALKVIPSSRVISQQLIIAGIVGALIPIGILIWAIVTISTRRRKHKP